MAEPDKKEEKDPSKEPEIRDVSELVDHSTIQLQGLDRRLEVMRQQLHELSQMAAEMQQRQMQVAQGTQPDDPMMSSQSPYPQPPYPQPQSSQPRPSQPQYPQPQPPQYSAQTAQAPPPPARSQPLQTWQAPPQYHTAPPRQGQEGVYGPSAAPSGVARTMGTSPYGYTASQRAQIRELEVGPPDGRSMPAASGEMEPDSTRSTRDLRKAPPRHRSPTVDIIDEGSEFQVQLELPGVNKDDLDIMVTDHAIVVEATSELEMDEGVVMVNERGPVVYHRSIQLPAQIDTKACKAKLKDGVLTLDVPKKEPTEGARRVEIAYG